MSNRDFVRVIVVCLAVICAFKSTGAVYQGNGSQVAGGEIGLGNLQLKDNGTTITATLNKGPGSWDDILVLFIDSTPGGFNNTSSFTENAPALVRAISGQEVGYHAHAVAN